MSNGKIATEWFFIGLTTALIGIAVALILTPPTYYTKRFPR